MKIRFMQVVDLWLGRLLCLLLTPLACVFNRIRRPGRYGSGRILLIELSEMGSAILAHSLLARCIERAGSAKDVYFLIFDRNKESIEILDLIPQENIILIESDNFPIFCVSTLIACLKMRTLRFAAVIDLELFSRFTAILSFVTRSPIRVGYDNFSEEGLYRGQGLITHKVWYNPHLHMSRNFLALEQALDFESSYEPGPRIQSPALPSAPRFAGVTDDRRQYWRERIAAQREHRGKIVLINTDPGQLELRSWPKRSWIRLITELTAAKNTVILCGLPSYRREAEELIREVNSRQLLSFVGETTDIKDVLAIMVDADLFITIDSGLAHFAPLVDAPQIVLFGPETPRRYSPLGSNTVSLYAELACSPCYSAANHRHSLCRNNVCLQSITVEQVMAEADKMLGRQA